MNVGQLTYVQGGLRRIEQDVKDLRRDLMSESIDTAGVDGMLNRIEQQASIALAGAEAVEKSLRDLL